MVDACVSREQFRFVLRIDAKSPELFLGDVFVGLKNERDATQAGLA